MTRDEWTNYICCVLTVRQELIDQNPSLVQELVNYVQGAGNWLDAKQDHRTKASEIAADRKYFNQDPAVIRYVMSCAGKSGEFAYAMSKRSLTTCAWTSTVSRIGRPPNESENRFGITWYSG